MAQFSVYSDLKSCFKYPVTNNTRMTALRTSEAGTALLPLEVGSYSAQMAVNASVKKTRALGVIHTIVRLQPCWGDIEKDR
jgi:hypothetical protein